jgi:hypothetical protein
VEKHTKDCESFTRGSHQQYVRNDRIRLLCSKLLGQPIVGGVIHPKLDGAITFQGARGDDVPGRMRVNGKHAVCTPATPTTVRKRNQEQQNPDARVPVWPSRV